MILKEFKPGMVKKKGRTPGGFMSPIMLWEIIVKKLKGCFMTGMERPSISLDLQSSYYFEGNWPILRYDDPDYKVGKVISN